METDIPRRITRVGCFSAVVLLYISIVFLLTGKYIRAIFVFMLYVSTCLHWGNLKDFSVYQIVDIILCIIVVSTSLYITSKYPKKFRYFYWAALALGGVIYGSIKYSHYLWGYQYMTLNYITCAMHILYLHIVLPLIYLWGFMNYEMPQIQYSNSPYILRASERLLQI